MARSRWWEEVKMARRKRDDVDGRDAEWTGVLIGWWARSRGCQSHRTTSILMDASRAGLEAFLPFGHDKYVHVG